MSSTVTERTIVREPFRARFYGRCPLGIDGVHGISVGDLIVKVDPGFRWMEQKVSQRMKAYMSMQTADHVHADCFDMYLYERSKDETE